MYDDKYPLKVETLSAEDGGGFVAYALDLPGCMSDGETEDQARENGRAAIRDWLDEARRLGRRIPEPKSVASSKSAPSEDRSERLEELGDGRSFSALHHHA